MADKLKKKPSFFSLKRFNSQKSVNEPTTPSTMNNPPFSKPAQSSKVNPPETRLRKESAGGIKDLVQCSLCLEILANPKMLPCQHTFCCACLKVYVADQPIIDCPICRTRIHVLKSNFVDELPSNLYIDTLLTMFGVEEKTEVNTPPTSPYTNLQSVDLFAGGVRCSQCRSMCDNSDISCCAHCKLNFCRVCWSQHLKDMQTQIGSILKELDAASNRLNHKIEHYKDRCEHIVEQINIAVEEKINGILETKINLLKEAATIQKSGDLSALALKSSMDEARSVSLQAMANKDNNDKNMVETFINLHQNTIQLLSEVSKWDLEKYVFDKESLSIESDSSMPYDAESDEPLPEAARQFDPMESEGSLILHYRSRKFIPHYSWRKTSRPCGVGVGPWNNHLYICGMDSHSVLVVERSQGKIVTRLSCQDMLCPVHIAFMKSLGEIYVTDKWKHCVHVFSKDGVYLRAFGQKGSRVGMFRSPEGIATDNDSSHIYVVDTGNDRVQVLDSEGKFLDQFGVIMKPQTLNAASIWTQQESLCTELNAPTAVAIVKDRVIILDSGNRRVKIYNKQDKNKITEFGSLGQRKGQFRQPEVLAVDPMGFILVGDSGNCRVQVFKPNGQLVRVFGGLGAEPGKFGWISGIHVTKQLDIIVSDTKNHNVNFF